MSSLPELVTELFEALARTTTNSNNLSHLNRRSGGGCGDGAVAGGAPRGSRGQETGLELQVALDIDVPRWVEGS